MGQNIRYCDPQGTHAWTWIQWYRDAMPYRSWLSETLWQVLLMECLAESWTPSCFLHVGSPQWSSFVGRCSWVVW